MMRKAHRQQLNQRVEATLEEYPPWRQKVRPNLTQGLVFCTFFMSVDVYYYRSWRQVLMSCLYNIAHGVLCRDTFLEIFFKLFDVCY